MLKCIFMYLFLGKILQIQASEQRSLYRSANGDGDILDLRKLEHHYLSGLKITSSMVEGILDCTSFCVRESTCSSFNIAVTPDSKGVYLCELLSTDKYRATDKLHANTSFHHYSPWSPCEKTPCKNGGLCLPEYKLNSYYCYGCQPGFAGKNCERTAKSCSEIKSRGLDSQNGSYIVDPDGEEGVTSFTVDCDMSDKNGVGVTVISHDSEDRIEVAGFEDPGSYARPVQYTGISSMSQLAALTQVSAYCEQYVKYECKGSLLLYNEDRNGWLVSRDGMMMKYWGGVTFNDHYKCACGVSESCANPDRGCNCDANDGTWREDSGFLTRKKDLPVSELRFGDTGSYPQEHGFHTLGKLKCYGQA